MSSHHPLLDLFAAALARRLSERADLALRGRFALGIDEGPRTSWWIVDLGKEIRDQICTRWPGKVDAMIVLGANEARGLLQGEPNLEDPAVFVEGDRRLCERFFAALLAPRSVLALRVGG